MSGESEYAKNLFSQLVGRGNSIDVGNTLINLGAETTIRLSQEMAGNVFAGETGIVFDGTKKGATSYWKNHINKLQDMNVEIQ